MGYGGWQIFEYVQKHIRHSAPFCADKMFASNFVLGLHFADLQIHFYKCFAACGGQRENGWLSVPHVV